MLKLRTCIEYHRVLNKYFLAGPNSKTVKNVLLKKYFEMDLLLLQQTHTRILCTAQKSSSLAEIFAWILDQTQLTIR